MPHPGKEIATPVYRFVQAVVPRAARQLLRERLEHTAARLMMLGRTPMPGPVTVAGLLSSAVGIGAGARLTVQGLETAGWAPTTWDLRERFPFHAPCAFEEESPAAAQGTGSIILQVNAPETPPALLAMGRRALRQRRIIGYWAWELPKLPKSWQRCRTLLDEIWVPSRFVQAAVQDGYARPVRVVPHPVSRPPISNLSREDFGLPATEPVFLCMFDVLSSAARKNPWGAIRAFREALGSHTKATLAIKISHANQDGAVIGELRELVAGADNIVLIDRNLASDDLGALMQTSTAFVSLHRSEGFGLTLAESMALGKPVIATGWSGNLDFMDATNAFLVDYDLVEVSDPQGAYEAESGQRWAEPHVGHAASLIAQLSQAPEALAAIGEKAKTSIAALQGRFEEAVRETGATGSRGPV